MKNQITETEPVAKITHEPLYQVVQERLHLPDGTPTPFFGNVRKDTGECLKAVSERYNIIQNADLIERAESIFANKGLNFKRKVDVTAGGARMFATYTFDNVGMKVQKDDFKFRLTVRNSFDGSMKVSLVVGLLRVVCSNGATIQEAGFDLMRKHTSSLDVEFASGAVDNAMTLFNRQYEALDAMSRAKLNQSEGHQVLNGLVKRNVIADRIADKVREIWDKPTYREDEARSVYNLWNATTQHLTHDVEGTRQKVELATRLNSDVTRTLIDYTRTGRISELFVKELQKNN